MKDQLKIILAEDDRDDSFLFQEALNRMPFDTHLYLAQDGELFMEMLYKQDIPDFIFLDLNMPKMSGLEFLEELRSSPDLKKLPVFITTTSSDDADVNAARKFGISGYIIKPLNFEGKGNKESAMDNFNLMLELLK